MKWMGWLSLCGGLVVGVAWGQTPAPTSLPAKKAVKVNTSKPKGNDVKPMDSATPGVRRSSSALVQSILESKTVRVCVRSDMPPLGFFRGDLLQGLDVALAKEIVTRLGMRYKTALRVQWVVIRAKDRVSSLQQDRCDLVVAAFSKTPARAKWVAFSSVYLRTHKVLLGRQKVHHKEPIVALVKTATKPSLSFAKAVYTKFLSYDDILHMMRRQLVDYVVTDHPTGLFLVRRAKGNYSVKRALPSKEEYALGVKKSHQIFLQEINGILDEMERSGRLAYLRSFWIR